MTDVFVDFTAANDGDGTAFGQAASPGGVGAYNTVVGKSFTAKDAWVRRGSLTITAQYVFNFLGARIIAWPKVGDVLYSSRPAAAQAAWDGDVADYAEIKNAVSVSTSLISIATNAGQEFHRMKFTMGYTTSSSIHSISQSVVANFFNCWIENQNNASATNPFVVNYSASGRSTYKNCTLAFSGTGSGSGAMGCITVGAGGIVELIDCTINQTNATWNPTSANAGLVVITGSGATVYLIGVTIASSSTNYAGKTNGNALVNGNGAGSIFMQDVSIATSSTAQSASLKVISTCALIGTRVKLPSVCYVSIASNGAVLHLSQYNQTVAVSSGYSLDVTGSGVKILGHNVTFFSGNASGDMQLSGLNGNQAFFQNVTFAHATPFGGAPGNFTGVWCADYGGTVGLWKFFGPNGTITSNNVYRTGGEAFSLKYDMDAGTAGDPLWRHLLAMYPAFETIYVSLPASSSTITLYGAHKGYGATPPDGSDIWFDIDYLDQASGGRRAFASSRDTAVVPASLTSDASVWNGDTSLTQFKLSVTVTPGQACLVPVRVFFKKRVASAYLYVDPRPAIS